MPSSSSPDSDPEAPTAPNDAPSLPSEEAPSDAPGASAHDAAPADSATLGAVQEPQRLHPFTLLLRIGASLPPLLLILVPTLRNPSSENVLGVALTIFYGVVALPAIVLQYLRFSYRITPKQIVIQKGVLKRQNRSIPIERIQNIQIQRNLVARLLGVAKVTIETAGSSATEGSLEYVGLSDAHEIRRAVRTFQHRTTEADVQAAGGDDEEASAG